MPFPAPLDWPDHTIETLQTMWATHHVRDIAKAIGNGVSEAAVYMKARRLGLTSRHDLKRLRSMPKRLSEIWTPELDAELIYLWRSHHTISDIGEIIGLPYNTIRSRSVSLGLPPRPRGIAFSRRNFVPTHPLEFAPGHQAADHRSFELLQQARTA